MAAVLSRRTLRWAGPAVAAAVLASLACESSPPAPASPALPYAAPTTAPPAATPPAGATITLPAPTHPPAAATAGPAPSPTPAATATVATHPPAPAPAPGPAPTATATPAPAAIAPLAPTPTSTPVPAEIAVSANEAAVSLPDGIEFSLAASSAVPLERVELEFGTQRVYTCASDSYSSVRLPFDPAPAVELGWEWNMRKTGSVPPGTTVWWRWRMQDAEGRPYVTPVQEVDYADTRYDWRSYTRGNITLHWYAGGDDFGETLADATAGNLASLDLGREVTRPINAFVYASAEDVRGAVLFAQQWTGGLAFPEHNALLISIRPSAAGDEIAGLAHELAHLLVAEVTFNCFGDLPRWLDEGLATYAEGGMGAYRQGVLDAAVAADSLITVRSLSSSFPAGHGAAHLSYAESRSIVAYLIDTYGWARMRELLEAFRRGSTYDGALLSAYGLDSDGLDREWRASPGLQAASATARPSV